MRDKFFSTLLANRLKILFAFLLFLAPFVVSALFLKPDFDVERYFPDSDSSMATFKQFKTRFNVQNGAVSLFWKEKSGINKQILREMAKVELLFRRAGLKRIISLNSEMVRKKFQDPLKFLSKEKENSFYNGILWNKNQDLFIITGFLPTEKDTDLNRKKVESVISKGLKSMQAPGRTLILSGEPIIRSRYLKLMAHDQIILIGGGILITFLLMFFLLKSIKYGLLALTAVIPAYIVTLGLLALSGHPFTAIMSMLPIIMLVVGLSDTIHILMPFKKYKESGIGNKDSVLLTFKEVALPCFFTSFTTAMGFLSLTFSGIAVIMDFAVATAVGIILTWCFSMVFYPLILSYSKNVKTEQTPPFVKKSIKFLGIMTGKKAAIIIISSIVISLGLGLFIPRVNIESYILNDLKEDNSIMKDLKFIEKQGIGVFQINIYLKGNSLNPSVFSFNEKLASFVKQSDIVTKALSINDFIYQGVGKNSLFSLSMLTGFSPKELKAKMDEFSEKSKGALSPVYHKASGSTQIILFVKDKGSHKINKFISALNGFIAKEKGGLSPEITGTVYLTQKTYKWLFRGFVISLVAAILIISLLFFFLTRSFQLAFMALLANFLPIIALLGFTGAIGYKLSPASLLVFTVAFGLVVDDTIHILSQIIVKQKEGLARKELLSYVMEVSGKAVILTSIVIAFGFSTMMLSSFQTIFDMGFLIPFALIFALAGDLLLLPSLYWIYAKKID